MALSILHVDQRKTRGRETDNPLLDTYLLPVTDGRPENHENALVGLVLIGRRLEEEKVTAMLKLMEHVVGVDY